MRTVDIVASELVLLHSFVFFCLNASFAVWLWWLVLPDLVFFSNTDERLFVVCFSMVFYENLAHSWTKLNCERTQFTNASRNTFTTFIMRKYSAVSSRLPKIWTHLRTTLPSFNFTNFNVTSLVWYVLHKWHNHFVQ